MREPQKGGKPNFRNTVGEAKGGGGGGGHDFLLKVSGGKTLEETMKLFFP